MLVKMKLSTEEKSDLLKYIRYFAIKACQIIVGSRCGHKDSTPCRTQSDWFNLNIAEIPELYASIKKSVSNELFKGVPICINVYMNTSDNENVIVETWYIKLLPQYSDPQPKITHTIYNQMGLLLRSLISVTRVIPGFKCTQNLSPDHSKITYLIYEHEPDYSNLGKYRKSRIGQICTPIGTLQLGVAFPYNLCEQLGRLEKSNGPLMVKSDHFNTNMSPKFGRNQSDDKQKKKYQPVRAAFAEPKSPRIREPIPTFKPGGIVINPKLYYSLTERKDLNESIKENLKIHEENESQDNSSEKEDNTDRVRTYSEELSLSEKSSSNENMSVMNKLSRQNSRKISKAVNYPFATPTPKSELVNFYRECAHAPPLTSLSSTPPQIQNISDQLNVFEKKAEEFDELVKSLCDSPDSEN